MAFLSQLQLCVSQIILEFRFLCSLELLVRDLSKEPPRAFRARTRSELSITVPTAQEKSRKPLKVHDFESASCWNRTNNLLIKSQLLCQLS